MLRQLASRTSSQLLELSCCSTSRAAAVAVATEVSRGGAALLRRGIATASSSSDGPMRSLSMSMIASSSGRSGSISPALDISFAPSTSYRSVVSSWGSSLGGAQQMRTRAFSTETETPGAGLNPLLRAPGPLPPPSATADTDVVPSSSSSTSSPATNGGASLLPLPLLTASQRQLRSRAVLKNIRISPKKLARFAKLVSGMHVEDALAQCSVARETKAAGLLRGVIASAAANARTNHGNLRGGGEDSSNSNFRVAEAIVGRAPTPTRPWYHGKGRTGVRHLYRSHLTIELEATSKPPLTRYQKPLLERQGKGRPPRRVAAARRRRDEEQEVAEKAA